MELFHFNNMNTGIFVILGAIGLLLIVMILISAYRVIKKYLTERFLESKTQITNYYNNTVDEIVALEKFIADFVETHNEQVSDSFYEEIKRVFERLEQAIGNAKQAVEKMNAQFLSVPFNTSSENALGQIEFMRSLQRYLWGIRTQLLNNEDKVQYEKRYQERIKQSTPEKNPKNYFSDCSGKREITKKYRFLIKQFHPDNGGSSEEFLKIKEQYEQALRSE